jgi:hypothetical protein
MVLGLEDRIIPANLASSKAKILSLRSAISGQLIVSKGLSGLNLFTIAGRGGDVPPMQTAGGMPFENGCVSS